MTLRQALDQRIPRVRKVVWANPTAYLRLPLLAEGYGPWAELYDERVQREVVGVRPGSQRVCVVGVYGDDDGYEVYDGPVSAYEAEAANYARGYAER